jgi:putative dimethyl sulfoxide reductase chaperone
MEMSFATSQDWVERLTGEILFCGLLSKALYTYPEKAWLNDLIAQDVFAEVPFGVGQADITVGMEILQKWSAENRGDVFDQAFDTLEADYMHLFVGPGKLLAPLWESVYADEERMLFQEVTLQVRAWYLRFGLQTANLYHEPDDHIGIEFGFLAHLAQLSLQALQAGDNRQFDALLQAQRDFLGEHMLRWVPVWARDVQADARTGLYRGLAHLACGALKELEIILRVPTPKEVTSNPLKGELSVCK